MYRLLFFVSISSFLFSGKPNLEDENILDLDPVYQRTPVWCWVSCGEMVFKYYNVCSINPAGDYQCGIIALLGPQCDMNCYTCQVPAGSTQRIINMFAQYPAYARQKCGSSKSTVKCTDVYSAISARDVKSCIDNEMPILAGINPGGQINSFESAHACLIIGYKIDDEGKMSLIVNDPFPYDRVNAPNPYTNAQGTELQKGQYEIKYRSFKSSLAWNRTLKNIR